VDRGSLESGNRESVGVRCLIWSVMFRKATRLSNRELKMESLEEALIRCL
jgi:hypothetical protein